MVAAAVVASSRHGISHNFSLDVCNAHPNCFPSTFCLSSTWEMMTPQKTGKHWKSEGFVNTVKIGFKKFKYFKVTF
jgi:hypothetical protein